MTYTVGGLIQAADYNGFVSTNSANVNGQWGTGSGGSGWGQTPLSTVSAAGVVTATNTYVKNWTCCRKCDICIGQCQHRHHHVSDQQ